MKTRDSFTHNVMLSKASIQIYNVSLNADHYFQPKFISEGLRKTCTARPTYRDTLLSILIMIIIGMLSVTTVIANPTGAEIARGQVQFNHPDLNTLNITNSNGAIINWQDFSIQQNEITRFIQNSTSSAILNRVTGQDPSSILGQLLSNGRVFVINPNGIVFGKDSVVDTAGLIASTLDMTDEDFIAGNLKYQGDNAGAIQSMGYIKAGANGDIFLIAPNIENSGIIETQGGQIMLAAGESITIASLDSDHIVFDVQAPENEVVNLGEIITNGGATSMFAGTIKHSGSINANSIGVDPSGNIVLSASKIITLAYGSRLTASGGASVEGGDVRLIAQVGFGDEPAVIYQHGNIDVSGTTGGSIEFLADNILHAGDLIADGLQNGGSINVNATGQIIALAAANVSANGQTGTGGQIKVTADENLITSSSYSSTGIKGGQIQLMGDDVRVAGASADVSGIDGGGNINIGGGYQGNDENIRNANRTLVTSSASFIADAIETGDGGQVIVWADGETFFTGSISSKGGADSGNGGFVEVSGKEVLKYGGSVDLTASTGELGTLLLDPKNISVSGSGGATVSAFEIVSPNVASFNSFGRDPNNGKAAVELNNGNLVLIDYGSDFGGSDAGAVYVFNPDGTTLIGTLLGAATNYDFGSGGVTALSNGNFVISSPRADIGATNTGAVSLHDDTGQYINGGGYGVATAANSLIGSSGDSISNNGVAALSNGNYVVLSGDWNTRRGAVTLGDGVNGTTGVVGNANSITFVTSTDGSFNSIRGITELSNGNFVINSPAYRTSFANRDRGAVILVNGTNGEFAVGGGFGAVTTSNSLIGVVGGASGDRVGFSGVFALPNGDYVVASSFWNSSTGAVSQMDGSTGQFVNGGGVTGITASNSILGAITGTSFQASDKTGSDLIVLSNGNYVVGTPGPSFGAIPGLGAATLIDGTNGQFLLGGGLGAINVGNSLFMDNEYSSTLTSLIALDNGNYIFSNPDNFDVSLRGRVVLINGLTGAEIGRINGFDADIEMGDGGITTLANGNYVILTIDDGDNGGSTGDFVGTILVNGTTGLEISRTLDVDTGDIGAADDDVVALSNGNYLVTVPEDNSNGLTDSGSVRLMDGTTGLEISRIEGDDTFDSIGDCFKFPCAVELNNGHYVLLNPFDYVGGVQQAGSVIVVDSTTGVEVDRVQLASSQPFDSFSGDGIVPLNNGNFVVLSRNISSAPSTFEGRMHLVTVSGGAATNLAFTDTPSATSTLSTSSIKSALEGGNLILQANNDFILDAGNDILVSNAGAGGSLTIQVGRSVILNSNIVTDNGNLTIIANETLANGVVDAQRDAGAAVITMATGTTINAGMGNISLTLSDGAGLTNSTSGDITLANLTTTGQVQIVGSNLNLIGGNSSSVQSEINTGTLNINLTGNMLLNGGTTTNTDADIIVAGDTTINVGGSLSLIAGPTSADVEITSGGNLLIITGADLILTGGSGSGASATMDSVTQLTLTVGGDLNLSSGSAFETDANIKSSSGDITANITGAVNLIGGMGQDADVELQADAGSLTLVTGGNVTITGGGGDGAFSEIISETLLDLTIGGNLVMTGGTAPDTDATLESQSGAVVANVSGSLSMVSGSGTDADVEFEADTSFVLSVGTNMTLDAISGGVDSFVFLGMTNADIAAFPGPLSIITGGNLFLRAGGQLDTTVDLQGAITTLNIGGNLDLIGGSGVSASVEIDQATTIDIDVGGNLIMIGGSNTDTPVLIGENNAGATVTIGKNAPVGGDITLTGGSHVEGLAAIGTTCTVGSCAATVVIDATGTVSLTSTTGEAFIGSQSYDNGDTAGTGSVSITSNTGNIDINNGSIKVRGNVNLTASNGAITQTTGRVRASKLIVQAQNFVSLMSSTNDFSQFTGNVTGSGNLDLVNDTSIDAFNGTTLDLLTISTTNGNININNSGDATLTGAITAGGAGSKVNLTVASSITGGATITAGSAVNLNATASIGSSGLAVNINTPNLTVSNATTDVNVLNVGGGTILSGMTLSGDLLVDATGPISQSGSLTVAGNSSFSAGANAITLSTAGNNFTGTVSLNNSGNNAVQIMNGLAMLLTNTSIGSGNFTITGSPSVTNTGILAFADGAVVTVPGTFLNEGILKPGNSPGALNIIGDYAQGPGGTFQVELGGAGIAGSDYDLLTVSGTATLDGTLDILLFGTYTGNDGDQFDIISSTDVINDFASINVPIGLTILASADKPVTGTYQLQIPSADFVTPTPDEDIIDIGTDQLIVLNEYQDDVVTGLIDPESDDEGDEKRELICR